MRILIAPLNWGLGHASRCVPLVHRFLEEGHEVILGGDGESLTLLRKHFPKLRYVYLAPLRLRYSQGGSQVWAMLKALPRLLVWSIKDHAMLKAVLREEHIDQVVSDNRFGLYISNRQSRSGRSSVSEQSERSVLCQAKPVTVYMTHQLHIRLPKGWRWAEGIASRIHARIYTRYNKVWIPDYEDPDKCLAGDLSRIPSSFHFSPSSFHFSPSSFHFSPSSFHYLGPLSRFADHSSNQSSNRQSSNRQSYDIVAVLSGLEPHRTLLEKELIARFTNPKSEISNPKSEIINHKFEIINPKSNVLIVQGLMNRPNTQFKRGNVTIVPYLGDRELADALLNAKHIIARSGYSTLMDLDALGLLNQKSEIINHKLELIPTPGQPEQEYLATFIEQKTLF